MIIKRLLAFCIVLGCAMCFAGCVDDGEGYTHDGPLCEDESTEDVIIPTFEEASEMTGEELLEALAGVHYEDIQAQWGEPDGMLSGFWGDIWIIDDEYMMILYYDSDGCVETVKISRRDPITTTPTGEE